MTKVLFVCVRNGGKSQMAAALLRHHAGPGIQVDSAGTDPGTKLNAQSIQALAEVDADMSGGVPKALTEDLVADADLVVVLGSEAHVEPVNGTPVITWETDEPSLRGIEGMDRMRPDPRRHHRPGPGPSPPLRCSGTPHATGHRRGRPRNRR